jgi:hypothetical protein
MIKKKLSHRVLRKVKRYMVTSLAVLLVSQNVMVAMASNPVSTGEANAAESDDSKRAGNYKKASPSEADPNEPDDEIDTDDEIIDDEIVDDEIIDDDFIENELPEDNTGLGSKNPGVATPDTALPKEVSIFDKMPKIGTAAFTKWFFENADSEELWEWVMELMSSEEETDEYTAFMEWYSANEDMIMQVRPKLFKIALFASSTGDLWTDWIGNTSWEGDGTKYNPYEINDIADLMGLSEMVASGESFAGTYFRLTQDIYLGGLTANGGSWNPIGWYQNKSQLGGSISNKFKGNFDGDGNSITGMKINSATNTLDNVGLFGAVEGGSIINLTVSADNGITGGDNVGVLAGSVSGDTIIRNVVVENTSISATGDAGGLVGQIDGLKNAKSGTVTIEDCKADGIKINSTTTGGYVGGIAGNVQNANIIDVEVFTYNGSSNRIQGQGYVGGIVGRLNKTNIYNSYVSGTIGGNGSRAIGGLVGMFNSGNVSIARFAGTIGNSNNGTASREGTFFGTREVSNDFSYGTGKNDNFSYLFTTSSSMAKKPFGSNIDKDNSFTTDAHIGYWENDEKVFHLVAGSLDQEVKGKYFYEELEDGVKYVVTSKLGNTFTADGYWEGCDFIINHFAPSPYGAPSRGYLVSIPRIDTKNANGTYESNVATFAATGKTNNSYYRQIDKDNPSAIAPGTVVEVVTAPNNKNGNRYQMVYDESQPGKVIPPTYTDEDGNQQYMGYVAGGSYTFTMPTVDTELNVEYVKVTTQLTMTPAETTLKVVQIRDGDRKNPQITTTVYDEAGKQIAKYIGDASQVTPTPVPVHSEHNGEGSTTDKTVKWSIDNSNLVTLSNVDVNTYTTKDAYIMPNLSSQFITNIIQKKVKEQVDSQYVQAIDNTIYSDVATLAATTNPDTSVNNVAVVGNTRVNVTFQIVDNTTRRVEGLNLNYSDIEYTITRKLTGDRTSPVETITCSEPTVLSAMLYPVQPFNKNVSWVDNGNGSFITLNRSGSHNEECAVNIRYDAEGKTNPAWIQNVINQDNQKRIQDKYVRMNGSSSYTEVVTATAEDQTHGVVSATCNVVINFKTIDETVIHPTTITMNRSSVDYGLSFTKAGDINSKTVSDSGFETVGLNCTIAPEITDEEIHEPYDRKVIWSVSDPDVLSIDQNGNIVPNKNAQWIKEAMNKAPYNATKTVEVYATANDSTYNAVGVTTVTLKYSTNCLELTEELITFDIKLLLTGRRTNPILTWSGADSKEIKAIPYQNKERAVTYSTSNGDILTINENGTMAPVLNVDSNWMKAAMSHPYTASTSVTISANDGRSTDTCVVTLNFKVTDNTTTGSSSGGGGGGGGGGSVGGKASSVGGATQGGPGSSATAMPSYVVSGKWVWNVNGKWTFADGTRAYANEWAAVQTGQNTFEWFKFDAEGFMVTGWYKDANGSDFYLNSLSDGTLGRMITGWQWIAGADGKERCYYFNGDSDGTKGKLVRSTAIKGADSAEYTVNENGEWTVNGVIQVR